MPRPLLTGMLELLDSAVRYSTLFTSVERTNVEAVCVQFTRLKGHVTLSFVFLRFDAPVGAGWLCAAGHQLLTARGEEPEVERGNVHRCEESDPSCESRRVAGLGV